ncbi:MarR family winged helix-turn-helix transcriptional regulator [Nakamurella deserti]|uniref:MarR family winged helix-turn-helix transcriptional regulator n=1 Tax=Nakamurella deserti TaxID=2164074 RepID=UPI000DBE9B31|nr:MarR family transcriptional regulator [Nakamurella deserti]
MSETRQALTADIGRAVQRYQRSVQAFDDAVGRRLGLGPADLRCLDWLTDGPMSAGRLSAATGLKPAATTALLDRLEGRGLVERFRDDRDRRVVLVRMTPKAAEQIAAMYQPMVQEGQTLFEGLTDHDLAVMRDYLDVCTALTDRHRTRVTGA